MILLKPLACLREFATIDANVFMIFIYIGYKFLCSFPDTYCSKTDSCSEKILLQQRFLCA